MNEETEYSEAISKIDELVILLERYGINPKINSHLENDYFLAQKLMDQYKNGQKIDDVGRSAISGLLELYYWIWSIKDCCEFNKIIPHLKLLVEASPRINEPVSIINPTTNKQDDKTNKFFEAILGMFAIKVGSNIDLDDPVASSNGDNPDIMFDFFGKRIAIACKTIRGKSMQTFLDNLNTAAIQISRSKCDIGYLAINPMNILEHKEIQGKIFDNPYDIVGLLANDLVKIYSNARIVGQEQLLQIIKNNPKCRPIIISLVHGCGITSSEIGNKTTSIKSSIITTLDVPGINTTADQILLSGVNEFIHRRL